MTKRALVLMIVAIASVLLQPQHLDGQALPRTLEGELWQSMADLERLTVLHGVVEGASITLETAVGLMGSNGAVAPLVRPGQEPMLRSVITRSAGLLADVEPTEMEPIVDVMTRLYSDPANSCVTLGSMAAVAVRRLRGQLSDSDVVQAVGRLRAAGGDRCSG